MWLILFFKPEDERCINLKDRYEKVAVKLYGIVTVAAVDCEEDEAICDEFEAYGVP